MKKITVEQEEHDVVSVFTKKRDFINFVNKLFDENEEDDSHLTRPVSKKEALHYLKTYCPMFFIMDELIKDAKEYYKKRGVKLHKKDLGSGERYYLECIDGNGLSLLVEVGYSEIKHRATQSQEHTEVADESL